jgi:hypothetical protein
MVKKILFALIILAIGGGLFWKFVWNKSHTDTAVATSDVVITPQSLLEAFNTDETKANATYLDKIVEIKGKVSSINTPEKGSSFTLDTGDPMSGVICEFETADGAQGIAAGQEVTVKGFCTGKLSDIVLSRCTVVK